LLAILIMLLATGLPGLTALWLRASAARRAVEQERDAVARAKGQAEKQREAARNHLYGAQASLMQIAWRDRKLGRVRQLLELQAPKQNEPDSRGFEWHYFRRLAEGGQITLSGHTDTVTAVAFSLDRRYLASGSLDGTVKLWELPTHLELLSFVGHTGGVVGLALRPDMRRLAAIGRDGKVYVRDTETGKEIFSLTGKSAGSGSVVYSADGKLLALAGKDGASIHDESGKELRIFRASP
jgi:WD40 repeat protein